MRGARREEERGQAALEFLTTYGWALLVILVMIGALSFFGILDPLKLVPERCTITTGFSCVDYFLSKFVSGVNQAEVRIFLKNDLGKSITILANSRNITCSDCQTGYTYCYTNSCGYIAGAGGYKTADLPYVAAPGDTFEILANAGIGANIIFPVAGSKQKVRFEFEYIEAGGLYPHKVEGEIFATVQEQ